MEDERKEELRKNDFHVMAAAAIESGNISLGILQVLRIEFGRHFTPFVL